MLYDTGPRYGPASDAGARVVAPNLRALGVERLDLMIVSHADSDHSGGALSVLDVVPVRWLMSSLTPDHPIVDRMRGASSRCVAGTSWKWDGVTFSVLWPRATDYGIPSIKTNDMSCVVRVEGSGGSALLTGDIEANDESSLLIAKANLNADVVVVPHHGSRTSTHATVCRGHRSIAGYIYARLSKSVWTPSTRNFDAISCRWGSGGAQRR